MEECIPELTTEWFFGAEYCIEFIEISEEMIKKRNSFKKLVLLLWNLLVLWLQVLLWFLVLSL